MYIVTGVTTGDTPMTLGTLGFLFPNGLFVTALIRLNGGLAGLAWWLRRRSPFLRSIGLAIALFGVVSLTHGFVRRVLVGQTIGGPGGMAVLGSCFSATLLGIAALRFQALPRRTTALLLFIGVLTFSLIIVLGMIANRWLPAWATDELPFAVSGLLWTIFGARVQHS